MSLKDKRTFGSTHQNQRGSLCRINWFMFLTRKVLVGEQRAENVRAHAGRSQFWVDSWIWNL